MDNEQYDFFLSRRGAVADLSREVAETLSANGYSVLLQDYDIPLTSNFIEKMHEAIKRSRDLIILFTQDYEESPFTRREFTSFEADRANSPEDSRRIIILRCDDVPLRGLLAANVYQDLAGIDDQADRAARILAAVRGQSQADRPPPRPFVGIPPRLTNFTGRVDALHRLDGILVGDKVATVTQASGHPPDVGRAAVFGLGGVGKSSLAAEYAHRYRDLYSGVLWCPAETRLGLVGALSELAGHLGIAHKEGADLEARARSALDRLATLRADWLLIYDNVPTPETIADLLPNGGARLLVTSRFPDWSGWAEEVALDSMPEQEASALLCSRAGRDDPSGAAVLAKALGGLPLALDHAGAFCRRTQTGFVDYAARMEAMLPSAPRGVSYPRSVAATFDLAIREASTEAAGARRMLDFIAQCAPERVPLSLTDGAFDNPAEAAQALLALVDTSLVRTDPFPDGRPAVTMHRLVQAVGRATATEADATQARLRMLERLRVSLPVFDAEDVETYPAAIAYLPHGLMLAQAPFADAERDFERIDVVLQQLRRSYAIGRGSQNDRIVVTLRSMQAHAVAAHGVLHPSTSRIVDQLMQTLHSSASTGNPAAHALMDERIALFEETQRLDALSALNTTIWLLRMYGSAHRRDLADRISALLARDLPALAERDGLLGEKHLDAACSAARLHRDGKRFTEARAVLAPVMRAILAGDAGIADQLQMALLYLECESDESDELANSLIGELEREALRAPATIPRLDIVNALVQHFRMAAFYARAKRLVEKAMPQAARKEELKSRWQWVRTQQHYLAVATGDYSNAAAQISAEIAEEERAKQKFDHDDTIRHRVQNKINWKKYDLSLIYAQQGYLIKSSEILYELKDLKDRSAKPASKMHFYDRRLVDVLAAQGQIDGAIELISQAGDGEVEAEIPFERAYNQALIGRLLHDAGRTDEARPILLEAASAYARLLALPEEEIELAGRGITHLRAGLSKVKRRLGDIAAAVDDLQRSFDSLDSNSLRIANLDMLEGLADWRQAQGSFADAINTRNEILHLCENSYGPDSIHTALALSEVGELHRAMGDLATAHACQQSALAGAIASQGDEAPLTARLRSRMAALMLDEGRTAEAALEARAAYTVLLAAGGAHSHDTRQARAVLERSGAHLAQA